MPRFVLYVNGSLGSPHRRQFYMAYSNQCDQIWQFIALWATIQS